MSSRNLAARPITTPIGMAALNTQYGLTKREYAAITILAALTQVTSQGRLPSVDDAVNLADRLFNQLEAPRKLGDVPALLKPQAG